VIAINNGEYAGFTAQLCPQWFTGITIFQYGIAKSSATYTKLKNLNADADVRVSGPVTYFGMSLPGTNLGDELMAKWSDSAAMTKVTDWFFEGYEEGAKELSLRELVLRVSLSDVGAEN